MKKENEKLQKINTDETKNVAGGHIIIYNRPSERTLYYVHDNESGRLLGTYTSHSQARRVNTQQCVSEPNSPRSNINSVKLTVKGTDYSDYTDYSESDD